VKTVLKVSERQGMAHVLFFLKMFVFYAGLIFLQQKLRPLCCREITDHDDLPSSAGSQLLVPRASKTTQWWANQGKRT
jgi:hypothetical protein